MEIYYTPNTTQIDLTTHHNFTCSIPPWYINIGYCYVQWLRTTWEYTKRHRSPPLLHTVTSHLEATSGFQTLTTADASPHWLNTLYTRYVTASTSGRRHRCDTRWQGRDLYPGQGDWLTWPISRSEWLIDTWRYLWLATWRPMEELPGWRHTVTSQTRHLVTSPEVRHITWHILDQSDRWKTYRMGATWRPMAEPNLTWKQYEMVTSPEVCHITWHLLDQSDHWKTYRMGRFKLPCILLTHWLKWVLLVIFESLS